MTFRPKGAVQVRLTQHGLWIAHPNYDRILEELPTRPAHSPLNYRCDLTLDSLPDDEELDDRHYHVAFTLGSPFNNPAQQDAEAFGDSLIQLGRRVHYTTLKGETEEVRLALVPNHLDRLARVVAFLPVDQVSDADDAEEWGFTVVRPLLSQLSALYRVPIETTLVEHFLYQPPKTVKYGRKVLTPYQVRELRMVDLYNLNPLHSYDSFLKAVNHYREGANSWSPLQRFLSWFKGIEALRTLQQELRKAHPELRFVRSVVSDTYSARTLFPQFVGKAHGALVEECLRNPYRNAVAHWGDGDPLQMTHDHHYGLTLYYNLCIVADDALHGILRSTIDAVQM